MSSAKADNLHKKVFVCKALSSTTQDPQKKKINSQKTPMCFSKCFSWSEQVYFSCSAVSAVLTVSQQEPS